MLNLLAVLQKLSLKISLDKVGYNSRFMLNLLAVLQKLTLKISLDKVRLILDLHVYSINYLFNRNLV